MDRMSRVLIDLFDGLPNVMFCIKDANGRYVEVNRAFAERAGLPAAEVIGRRATELFAPDLAATYEAQDAAVRATGRPLRNQLELIAKPDGAPGWYLTTKVTTTDAEGRVDGIASVSVDLDAPGERDQTVAGLARAVAVARARFTEPLRSEELAAAAGLSLTQLERQMRRVFGLSTKQFVLRLRLEEAIRLLKGSDLSVAEVAARCGYYDQAAFTRQFKRVVGLTPGRYRMTT